MLVQKWISYLQRTILNNNNLNNNFYFQYQLFFLACFITFVLENLKLNKKNTKWEKYLCKYIDVELLIKLPKQKNNFSQGSLLLNLTFSVLYHCHYFFVELATFKKLYDN